MPRLRLRTRFLLAMLLITAGLTLTSLFLVRRTVENNVRQSIAINLRNSVSVFQDYLHERETMLTSDVALLADLPITRAIMTGSDPVTIQDASQDVADIVLYGPAHKEEAGERQSCSDQQHGQQEARAQPQSRHEYSRRIAWK